MLRRRVIGDTDIMHCSVATADCDRESIGKILIDERGDRLSFRDAVGAHEKVAVRMPLEAFKRNYHAAISVVHH